MIILFWLEGSIVIIEVKARRALFNSPSVEILGIESNQI
jgi:hypothetical protein